MKRNRSILFVAVSVIAGIFLIFILVFVMSRKIATGPASGSSDTTPIVGEKRLKKADTYSVCIIDMTAQVHSRTYELSTEVIGDILNNSLNKGNNRTVIRFTLPDNTVSWSFYIGVDQAGSEVYSDASERLKAASKSLIFYDPLVALAMNVPSFLVGIPAGENIKYWIVDSQNLDLFLDGHNPISFRNGDVVNDFARMTSPLSGEYNLCLENDNITQAINVMVKITAICEEEKRELLRVLKR